MSPVARFMIAFAALLAMNTGSVADTVLMKKGVTYDGKLLGRAGGLIRLQSGDHEVVVPEADVASVETNDKTGEVVDYAEIERLAAEHDKELLKKTGLRAQDRSAVDQLLKVMFVGDEAGLTSARHALLGMVNDHNPYQYLKMRLPEIYPMKVAPLLEVMFEMNPEDMRETLVQNASSASESARAASLNCLGRLKDRSVLDLMKGGLADEYPEVRIAAIHGVEALGAREATPVLIRAQKAGDMRVQNAARTALSTLWTEPGQPPPDLPDSEAWMKLWKERAASVPAAWDPDAIEPLVPPGTVCMPH